MDGATAADVGKEHGWRVNPNDACRAASPPQKTGAARHGAGRPGALFFGVWYPPQKAGMYNAPKYRNRPVVAHRLFLSPIGFQKMAILLNHP